MNWEIIVTFATIISLVVTGYVSLRGLPFRRVDAWKSMSETIVNLSEQVGKQGKEIEELKREVENLTAENVTEKKYREQLQKTVNELIVGVDILTNQLIENLIIPRWQRKKEGEVK